MIADVELKSGDVFVIKILHIKHFFTTSNFVLQNFKLFIIFCAENID
jgi:hypothetical protein